MKLHNILSKLRQTAPLHLWEGLGVGLCLLLFTACETIDEADRWTEPTPIEMKKNVLVEDFTGQKCSNCPTAAALIHTLLGTSMGEHIIAVSIHGGGMSLNINKDRFGLATDIGDDYIVNHWGNPALPAGLIDRTDGKGNIGRTCVFEDWTAAIVSQLKKPCLADLALVTNYDAEKRELSVTSSVTLTDGIIPADCRLTVWLTESGIVARQDLPNGGGTDLNYVHNHVLRDALSDSYGDVLTIESNRATCSYTYTIPATYGRNKWAVNPDNMAVVAFVTDKSGEVLQVIDVPVVKQ